MGHMRKKRTERKRIRLDRDLETKLQSIADASPAVQVSIQTVANYAIRWGMTSARKLFNPERK